MRSYTGCVTCKHRKLKCDEVQPVCGQCIKSSRDCLFVERSVFRTFEVESLTGQRQNGTGEPSVLFPESHVWLDIPAELTFVHVEDPWDIDAPEVSQGNDATQPSRDWDDCPHENHHEGQVHAHEDCVQDAPSMQPASPLTRAPSSPDSPAEQQADASILALQLMRHFKEGPGQWMDLFDTSAYFSCKILVTATTRPLLKSAVCALAAKHLQHVHASSETSGGNSLLSGGQHRHPFSSSQVDWQYQAAKHYHQAIRHLKTGVNSLASEAVLSDTEELFAAVAILCTYELMDAPGTAWRAHLSALPLFSPAPDPSSTPWSPVSIPRTVVKGPVFWSLARQDLLCAFISETQTRLNLRNIRLWQNAGLATDAEGLLLPFSPSGTAGIRTSADVEEDTRSNELTWLLGKIANHLTSGDALNPEDYSLPRGQRPAIGVTQEQLLERWNLLKSELCKWHVSLPMSFTPIARTKLPTRASPAQIFDFNGFEQIWYELPICAATMQSYHMACILLLVNQPQESTAIRSTVSARLKSYRHIQVEVLRHAHEICGISLANPPDPVRVHSVQPLFVAGQVFYETREQKVVLELLASIERDLGWTTSYHSARLVDEWPFGDPGGDANEGARRETEWVFSSPCSLG